jgi:hypothetical protein
VRDILLFGWSENFSHQGPEHGHIDNCKRPANCTNNKEAYLTVLRAHSREGHLQYLKSLKADLADAAQEAASGPRTIGSTARPFSGDGKHQVAILRLNSAPLRVQDLSFSREASIPNLTCTAR